jgi:chemotaxis protein histidine kinase CheA
MDPQRNERLLGVFMADAEERMRALLQARVVLETAPADPQAWDQVRRAAHTVAGNAAMMGLDGVAKAARTMERRSVAVAERGGVPADVWALDGALGALRRLLADIVAPAPRAGAAA